jgi:hypothetical protein
MRRKERQERPRECQRGKRLIGKVGKLSGEVGRRVE